MRKGKTKTLQSKVSGKTCIHYYFRQIAQVKIWLLMQESGTQCGVTSKKNFFAIPNFIK